MNFEKLEKMLDSFLALGVPGYDFIVKKGGETVYRKFNGFSNLSARIPMNGKERYHIFSCSKPITCTAALQLWEKGLFGLDDKLGDYMPEFREMTVWGEDGKIVPAKNPILIRNLFTMTAGFDYNTQSKSLLRAFDETHGACPTRETMKYLAQEPLSFEPGAMWQYSLCHDVLAAFVEVVSGKRFEEYVKENVFDPLEMNDSTFLLPRSEQNTVCTQYYQTADHPNVVTALNNDAATLHTYRLGADYASGGAGCVSTVEDYIRFLEALRKGDEILKKDTIRMMISSQLTPEQDNTYWNKGLHNYGLGVRCPLEGVSTDFGWGGAAGAFLAVDPENDFTMFYAQHVLNSPNREYRGKLPQMVKEALAE